MNSDKSEFRFDLSGGVLSLDFANTLSGRIDPDKRADHLESYDDLVAFARQSKLIATADAKQLLAQASRRPNEIRRVLRKAIALREAIYRVFSAQVAGRSCHADDLRLIDRFAAEALSHRRLARANGGYRWRWNWDDSTLLEHVLWPIAESAADLLTSSELGSIRECEAGDCAWLFLDESRNHSRRWCDMKVCGNREKARRHYRRTRM